MGISVLLKVDLEKLVGSLPYKYKPLDIIVPSFDYISNPRTPYQASWVPCLIHYFHPGYFVA